MKKGLRALVVVLAVTVLAGCDGWMDGSYSSVRPHLADKDLGGQSVANVTNYEQLRDAVVDLVEDGRQSGIISVPNMQSVTVGQYMERAIAYVTTNNAIGAYALDQITYELGTNSGTEAVAVNLTYTHGRSEIMRIRQVDSMDAALNLIYANLDNCTAGLVLKVSDYTDVDIAQIVEDYARIHPEMVMEIPQVSSMVYPVSGKERVLDISFTYQNSRDDLRAMQQKVRPIFTAAEMYVRGTTDESEKFSQLYAYLMERHSLFKEKTSITPSYSLLMYGIGDSRALANVYQAMCVQAGLDCQAVSGTKNGTAWYWNLIYIDGQRYHVDLLQCARIGEFQLMTEEMMSNYVWDYLAFDDSQSQSVEQP